MFADDRATHLAQATRYTCVEWLVARELAESYHARATEAFFAGHDHAKEGTTAIQLLKFVKSLGDVSLHLFSSLGHTIEMYKPANARHAICAIVSDKHEGGRSFPS
jgi:hypothetical protein